MGPPDSVALAAAGARRCLRHEPWLDRLVSARTIPPPRSTGAARSGTASRARAVSDLIADRDPLVEQRLGDAVFRLRRARKYCRQDLVGLARLDYEALTDGRCSRGR